MKAIILHRFIRVYMSCMLSLSVFMPGPVRAQPSIDKDTVGIMKLVDEANRLRFQQPDSFLHFANKVLSQARQIDYKKAIAHLLNSIGEFHRVSGNYPEALEKFVEARELAETAGETFIQGQSIGFIGITYTALGEYHKAIQNLRQAFSITMESPAAPIPGFFLSNLGDAYDKMNQMDSALFYQRRAWEFARRGSMKPGQAYVLGKMGVLHGKLKNIDSAFYYFNRGLETSNTDVLNRGRIYYYLAELFTNLGNVDSAKKYGRLSVDAGSLSKQRNMIMDAADLLYKNYLKIGARDSALYFLQLNSRLKDSLFGPERFRKMQVLAINEQESKFLAEKEQQELKSQLEKSQIRTKSRYRTIAFSVTILFIGLFALFVWRNLKRQKKTLKELKLTQSQLIQSEKMASLGELTAGIAHEIQNPLNFVNNFSEVNKELIDELKELLAPEKNLDANNIADTIKENEEKISHHGKRADAIVKNMLQHSRVTAGHKEKIDINALSDEYMRLAYHGLRAKDKMFNAKLETDFDPTIERIEVVPQDLGRVLLNLISNALFAVDEKRKSGANDYEPTVKITSKKMSDKVEIKVLDNGSGISPKLLDKIFQPFFTTKATGQGTGLGLSLSYDIIKAHGGEIKVKSKEGEGSEFIIELPV